MRRLLPLAFTAVLAAADLQIDHVTVAGGDLKKMQADLATVGLQSVYGGPHATGTTEMALVSFPDGSYLELIAPRSGAASNGVANEAWAAFLAGDGKPCAWAARVKDLGVEVKRLRNAGVEVSEPVRNGRARPDGVKLEWETARVGTQPNGTFFPFLIHDFTPREKRAFPGGKASTSDFAGVSRVVIAVRDLDEAASRYRRAYGLPIPMKQVDGEFGAHLAALGATPVILAQPLRTDSWLGERLERFGEGPCAFILMVRKAKHYKALSKARWFGTDVSWLDVARLGWRLGFEGSE